MSTNVGSSAGNAVISVSAVGGIVATVNEYAVLISLGLTLLGLLIGLTFHVIGVCDRRRSMRYEQQDNERIKALERQLEDLVNAQKKASED